VVPTVVVEDRLCVARRAAGGQVEIRDVGLVESALARPQASPSGADAFPTLLEKGAALLHSIVGNHALVDGNKRLGSGCGPFTSRSQWPQVRSTPSATSSVGSMAPPSPGAGSSVRCGQVPRQAAGAVAVGAGAGPSRTTSPGTRSMRMPPVVTWS
jgi:hypothetical protein